MRLSTIAAALTLAATPIAGVNAMPLAQPLPLAGSDAPAVTLTSGGCGIGFHRGLYGVCRPNLYGGFGFRRFGYGYRGYGFHRFGYRRFGYRY